MKDNHCDGCTSSDTCVYLYVNIDGICACSLCIIKSMCKDPCEEYIIIMSELRKLMRKKGGEW